MVRAGPVVGFAGGGTRDARKAKGQKREAKVSGPGSELEAGRQPPRPAAAVQGRQEAGEPEEKGKAFRVQEQGPGPQAPGVRPSEERPKWKGSRPQAPGFRPLPDPRQKAKGEGQREERPRWEKPGPKWGKPPRRDWRPETGDRRPQQKGPRPPATGSKAPGSNAPGFRPLPDPRQKAKGEGRNEERPRWEKPAPKWGKPQSKSQPWRGPKPGARKGPRGRR